MDVPLQFPPEILALRDSRGMKDVHDSVNYREYDREVSGFVSLIGRVKSHPTVAEKFYPDLFKIYFPGGVVQASAY